jgi:single-strand DNA-binding protein
MLNKTILMGRLTKDPEIRYTQSAEPVPVARFGLAVDRDFVKGDKKTDFFDIEAWRKKAEFAEKYLKKGQQIVVEGRSQQNNWTDDKGNNRTSYTVVAENIYFAGGKKEKDESDVTQNASYDGNGGFDPFADSEDMGFDPFNQ